LYHFDTTFRALTGNGPFPWQGALYAKFATGKFPRSCNIPTGLGKTSVVAVWLIALANHPDRLPRRLVYVVNRRTVVDQTTTEVAKLRTHLRDAGLFESLSRLCALPLQPDEVPLAISTLRGQFADNREWSADPARPAVIAGTVDMIGSRLLFSGYRVGFKARPLHAGFLGQDVLLVHDEAHLEPAFQELMESIQREQHERERVGELPWRKLQVMALTATSRNGDSTRNDTFELTEAERNPLPEIPDRPTEPLHLAWRRLKARKTLDFLPLDDEKKELADAISRLALEAKFKDSRQDILIYAQTVENVEKVVAKLNKERQQVQQLTGTMRGLERDDLPKDRIFARFLPTANRPNGVAPVDGTVYLVCTSAGEVGVNLSADHLICDLTTFERMVQRFGRVNRFGDRTDTEIEVVHPKKFDEKDTHAQRRKKTLELLQQLNGDASPAALSQLDLAARQAAFTPKPDIPLATDILFDSWALTTIREGLPGRPPVEPYLHGIEDQKNAETHIAWREEVWELRRDVSTDKEREELESYAADLLEDYPLKPHELLRDSTYRRNTGIRDKLAVLAARNPDYPIWIQEPDGTVLVKVLGDLPELPLHGRTVILPPQAGGLMIDNGRSTGLFDGSKFQSGHPQLYDVADAWPDDDGKPRRCRSVWDDDDPPAGMRLVRTVDTNRKADEDAEAEPPDRRYWYWYVRPRFADDDASKTAEKPVRGEHHTSQVTAYAQEIATRLGLPAGLQRALILAAKFHDWGKKREMWQRSIGNPNPQDWYAKSGRPWKPRDINENYRHEFGSLLDAESDPEFQDLSSEQRDLVRHLIAAHHGRGRPHFPEQEAFDPEPKCADVAAHAAEVPRRFARLQRKYGRWGLAYLESLLRAADYAASVNPSKPEGNQ
jgi:CRISPR-associated endonuclease/helicase Cas3